MENRSSNNNNAIASLVLGILALLCVFLRAGGHVLGLILGIVGLVLGNSAKRQGAGSMATTGRVLNIVAIVLCAFGIIFRVFVGAAAIATGLGFLNWLFR